MDSRVARATPLDTRAARMTEEEAFQPSRKNLSPLLSPSRSRNRESSVVAVGLHTPRHPMAPLQGACGRGCAPVPNSICGRGLSERSEFRSPNLRDPGQRHPKGHARAPMVLGPFAETKEPVLSRAKEPRRGGTKPRILPPRRGGTKPRKHSSPLPLLSCISRL